MTTLETLAPYLAHGIEVATPRKRGKLIGLNCANFQCPVETEQPEEYVGLLTGIFYYDYEHVTPILYSFADLCTPLADGTVPAVEFAKICLGEEVGWKKAYAHYQPKEEDEGDGNGFPSDETVEVGGQDEWEPDNRISFTIYPDWTWYGYGRNENCAPAAAIDYLRSKHFAVGLTEGQYIRKEVART